MRKLFASLPLTCNGSCALSSRLLLQTALRNEHQENKESSSDQHGLETKDSGGNTQFFRNFHGYLLARNRSLLDPNQVRKFPPKTEGWRRAQVRLRATRRAENGRQASGLPGLPLRAAVGAGVAIRMATRALTSRTAPMHTRPQHSHNVGHTSFQIDFPINAPCRFFAGRPAKNAFHRNLVVAGGTFA